MERSGRARHGERLDDRRFVDVAHERFALGAPGEHPAFEVDGVVTPFDEELRGPTGPRARATDADDQAITRHFLQVVGTSLRGMCGVRGPARLPFVVLADIQQECAAIEEFEHFGDVDIACFGHDQSFVTARCQFQRIYS